jgi:hypothetical protein
VTLTPAAKVRRARKWWGWMVLAALSAGAMLLVYFAFPHAGLGPKQPIYFSHRVHAGVKQIDCRFCHPFVGRSARAGVPPMEKCFFCHDHVIPLHPQIVQEKEHLERGEPVRWVKTIELPDHVRFRHEPHVSWGKLACSECHGPVETLDRLPRVRFEMGFCIGCHRKRGAQLDCWLACHH